MVATLVALALSGCGERGRASGGAGGTGSPGDRAGTPAGVPGGPPTGPGDRAAALAAPAGGAYAAGGAGGGTGGGTGGGRAARPVTPLFHGEPMWAENRRGGAEDNARYQFEHRGADIGASSLDDYLTRVHAFFDHPPADAETMTRPGNGDLLIYSPGANLFGVRRKDGAPRLLMRPASGRAYWEAQRNPAGTTGAGLSAMR